MKQKALNMKRPIFLLICRTRLTEWREKLVEAVSSIDDDLMMKYLEGEEISEDEIRKALRKGTIELKIVPVVTGSAFKNKGVQTMLDAVVDYLPSPLGCSGDRRHQSENGRNRNA